MNALDLLIAKRAELGTKQLSEDLDCSESAIRGICTGHYAGNPAHILQRAMRKYRDVIECPYLDGERIPMAECQTRSTAPKPHGGQARLAWWQSCQQCENRGKKHD